MSRYASPGTVSFGCTADSPCGGSSFSYPDTPGGRARAEREAADMARSDHHRVETSWDMGASGAAGGSTIGGVGCAAGANG